MVGLVSSCIKGGYSLRNMEIYKNCIILKDLSIHYCSKATLVRIVAKPEVEVRFVVCVPEIAAANYRSP